MGIPEEKPVVISVTFTAVPSTRTTPKGGHSRQAKNPEKSSKPVKSHTTKGSARSTPRHDPHKGKTLDLSLSRRDDIGTERKSEGSQSRDAISRERQSSRGKSRERQSSRRSDPSRDRPSSRESSEKLPTKTSSKKAKSTERPISRGKGEDDDMVGRTRYTPEDREIDRTWQAQAYREWARQIREEDRLRKKAHMRGVIRNRVDFIKENTSNAVGSILGYASACQDVNWTKLKEEATSVVQTEYQGAISCWHATPSLVDDMANDLVANCVAVADSMDESDAGSIVDTGDDTGSTAGDAPFSNADSKVPVPGLHSAKKLINYVLDNGFPTESLSCRVPGKDVVDESMSRALRAFETSAILKAFGRTQMASDQVQHESTQDPIVVAEKGDEGNVPPVEPSLGDASHPANLERKIEKENRGFMADKNEGTSIVADTTAQIDIQLGPDDEGRSEVGNPSSIFPRNSFNSIVEEVVEAPEAADHKTFFFIHPTKIDRGNSRLSRNEPPEMEDERRATIPQDPSGTAPIEDDTSAFQDFGGIVLHACSMTKKAEEAGTAQNEYKPNPLKDQQPSNVPHDEHNADSADRADLSIRVSDSFPRDKEVVDAIGESLTNSHCTFGPTSTLQGVDCASNDDLDELVDSSRYDGSYDELDELAIERTWTAVFPTIQVKSQSSMDPKSLHEKIPSEFISARDGKDVGIVFNPISPHIALTPTTVSPNAKPFWARAAQLVRRGRRKLEKLEEEEELHANDSTSPPGVLIDQVWIPRACFQNEILYRRN
jgi:hypothetical protein